MQNMLKPKLLRLELGASDIKCEIKNINPSQELLKEH